ncbi:MAG: helical backbone metal receptor [Balneola sp.]
MPYKRIICLVPSLTELLIDLGVNNRLIGRTKFCIHPEEIIKEIPTYGGTKNPQIEDIIKSNPDLIIANKEENQKEDIEELARHTEVVLTEIDTIEQALDWILKLGLKMDRTDESRRLVNEINSTLQQVPETKPLRTAYFIWKDPWMTVGHDTYIHDVMEKYSLMNVFVDQARYPTTNIEDLSSLNPELILLSSEPYPFKEKHISELKDVCPDSKIELVNGEWFSWYGSRMTPAFQSLNNWREGLSRK